MSKKTEVIEAAKNLLVALKFDSATRSLDYRTAAYILALEQSVAGDTAKEDTMGRMNWRVTPKEGGWMIETEDYRYDFVFETKEAAQTVIDRSTDTYLLRDSWKLIHGEGQP